MKSRQTDPLLIAMLLVIGMVGIVLSVIAPLAYLWIAGLIACFGVGFTTIITLGGMSPMCLFFFGGEVIKCGFYVIGAILSGLADASK